MDRTRSLLAPIVGTGLLMAGYLLIRPYGDTPQGGGLASATAFASPRWIVAHLCGVLAIASFARLALRLHDAAPGATARFARWSALAGTVLVLPYYGAETFGLHVLGRAALAGDTAALVLVEQVRNQPVALVLFGLGLLLLATAGLATALAWQSSGLVTGPARRAAWPLGVMVALLLPQFYLPAEGRMAFGVAYGLAAVLLLAALLRAAVPPSGQVRGAVVLDDLGLSRRRP